MTETDEEIEFHVAEATEKLMARGLSKAAARAEAERQFGDRRIYRQRLARIDRRKARLLAFDGLRLDVRYAIRSLARSPAFTITSLVILAIGFAATTAILSVADAVLLRGLPYEQSDRLVAVGERRDGISDPNDPAAINRMAPQDYVDMVTMQRSFSAIGAMAAGSITLQSSGDDPEDILYQRVTAGFFDALRARPAIGRAIVASEETDGHQHVALISTPLWQRRFGGAGVIGRTMSLGGDRFEIIGVMPAGFSYPASAPRPADVWIPYVVPPAERTRTSGKLAMYLQVVARLAPGVSIDRARTEIQQIASRVETANPVWNKNVRFGVRPLRDHLVGTKASMWMWMLLGSVALVLAVACANVASLFLSRAAVRSREIAIRLALGSNRWRIGRQLMVEGLLVTTAGTTIGLVLAAWIVDLLRAATPEDVPRAAAIALNLRVVTIAGLASVTAGVIFGLLPILRTARADLRGRFNGRGTTDSDHGRLRKVIVVSEIAIAVVLVVGAALFVGSFLSILRLDLGFKTDHVLMARIAAPAAPGQPAADRRREFGAITDAIDSAPGVIDAGMILGGAPLSGAMSFATLVTEATPDAGKGVSFRRVSPDYFKALRIPLTRGRFFTADDRDGAPPRVILNDAAVSAYLPQRNPIGQSVKIDDVAHEVVGVVATSRQGTLETAPRAEAFVPLAYGATQAGDLVVHTDGDPLAILPTVKAAVAQQLPGVPLRDVKTMDRVYAAVTAQRRLNMLVLALFGVLALVIAAVGIYGVMAQFVAQRLRELGIRMALGASRPSVVRLVLRSAMSLVVTGILLGGIAAWLLRATVESFLFGVRPSDPGAFAAAIALLAATALVASAFPAHRAAGLNPLDTLRSE